MKMIQTLKEMVSWIFDYFNSVIFIRYFLGSQPHNSLHEIGSTDQGSQAESLFRKFANNLGMLPTWDPVDVQHKLTYTKSKLWTAKQSALRGTKDIINETSFRKSLSNGSTFIACIKTSNLKSHDQDDEQKVKNFLVDLGEPFIWCCARGLFKNNRIGETDFDKFSTEYIDVPNLMFDAYDENDLMRVYCPMTDIYVALQMECEEKVSVFYHEEVFSSKKHRQKKFLKLSLKGIKN